MLITEFYEYFYNSQKRNSSALIIINKTIITVRLYHSLIMNESGSEVCESLLLVWPLTCYLQQKKTLLLIYKKT